MSRIYGRAGGSLHNADWLGSSGQGAARVGATGESRTAKLLNEYAKLDNGVTVLHDLRVPSSKYKANIDHVVISGHHVYVIDSKVWKPGFYFTIGSKTFRGLFERFEPAEKQTMVVIENALRAMADKANAPASIQPSKLFLWSSRKSGKFNTWLLRVAGAQVLHGSAIERFARKNFTPRKHALGRGATSADPALVELFKQLVI